jgi:hypothetical protein
MLSTASRQALQGKRSVTATTRPSHGYCCPGKQSSRTCSTTTRAWSELIAAAEAIPASPYFPVAAAGMGAFSYAYLLPFWQNTRPMSKPQYKAEVAGVYNLYTSTTTKKSKTVSGTTSKRSKAGTIRIKAK